MNAPSNVFPVGSNHVRRTCAKLSFAGALALALTIALPDTAQAISLTLESVPAQTVGPQSSSNPCIIAATQCQQPAGFGFNNFVASGGDPDYNMYSTTPTAAVADGVQGTPYTVAQLEALGSSLFKVAIDVNTTAAAGETLQLFQVIIGGIVVYDYIGPTVIGGISSNGNGYADWTLGTIDLSSYADNVTVLFHAVWTNATDGGESFFLLPQTGGGNTDGQPVVPEPASLLLFGTGMSIIAAKVRNRLKTRT